MSDKWLDILYQKNKFLREIDNAPPSNKRSLVLLWDIEDNTFNTNNFHPSKVHYRIGIDETKKVV